MNHFLSLIDDAFFTGFCAVEDLKKHSFLHPELDLGLKFAVSLAYPLNQAVFQSFDKYPSLIYQNHYRAVNIKLEQEALKLSRSLENAGYRALIAPASCSLDPLHGHLSHRMAAMLSGLGWIGKSALLITPEYAAKIRLITLLTDYPMTEPRPPIEFACCGCDRCIEICPVKAISHDPRSINREKCYKYLKSLIKRNIVQELICGLCIKVCQANAA